MEFTNLLLLTKVFILPATQSNFLSCRLSEIASRFAMRVILAEDLLLLMLCLVECMKCFLTLVVVMGTPQCTNVRLFARLVKVLLGVQTLTNVQCLVFGLRCVVEGWNPSMCSDLPVKSLSSLLICMRLSREVSQGNRAASRSATEPRPPVVRDAWPRHEERQRASQA